MPVFPVISFKYVTMYFVSFMTMMKHNVAIFANQKKEQGDDLSLPLSYSTMADRASVLGLSKIGELAQFNIGIVTRHFNIEIATMHSITGLRQHMSMHII